jgi:hypothetical protein
MEHLQTQKLKKPTVAQYICKWSLQYVVSEILISQLNVSQLPSQTERYAFQTAVT